MLGIDIKIENVYNFEKAIREILYAKADHVSTFIPGIFRYIFKDSDVAKFDGCKTELGNNKIPFQITKW